MEQRPLRKAKENKGTYQRSNAMAVANMATISSNCPKEAKGVKKLKNGPSGPKQESGTATEDAIT